MNTFYSSCNERKGWKVIKIKQIQQKRTKHKNEAQEKDNAW